MVDSKVLSVSGVVIKDNKVLLIRHNYGRAKGRLVIPGGYLKIGEMPIDAIKREVFEETNIQCDVNKLVAMRFTSINWWAIFSMEYKSGEPKLEAYENSEAIFMDIEEALNNKNTTEISKYAIKMAINNKEKNFNYLEYASEGISTEDYSLWSSLALA